MITEQEKLALRYRTKLVMQNLRNSHSGAEAHEVGNMLHTAQMILDVLEDEKDCEDVLSTLVKNVEDQQLQFFKKRYKYMDP